jgi:hypothetical protein
MARDIRSLLQDAVPTRAPERPFGDIWQRSRTLRTRRMIAAAGALGIAAALIVFTARTTELSSSVPPANTVPVDDHFDAIEIAGTPTTIGFGHGSAWVGVPGSGDQDWALFRLDPSTQEIDAVIAASAPVHVPGTLDVERGVPVDIAFSDGRVWLAVWDPPGDLRADGKLVEIDPGSNEVVHTLHGLEAPEPPELSITEGMVWIAAGGRLTPYDVHLRELGRDLFPGPGAQVASLGDEVWVGDDAGDLARVEGGHLSRSSRLAGPVKDLVSDGTALYAAVDRPGSKFQIARIDSTDRRTEDPIRRFGLDLEPTDLVFADGYLWALLHAPGIENDELDGTVIRIDPVEMRPLLQPIPAGDGATKLAVGEGSVWVTKPTGALVTRIDENPYDS